MQKRYSLFKKVTQFGKGGLTIALLCGLTLMSNALDRYGGQYNVVPDTSPYTFNYRFYRDPGKTGVNDFEYRSIMDDIYKIWNSSNVMSECDRWKACNLLIQTRVDPYMKYPPGVQRSSVPFDETSLVYFSTNEAVAFGFLTENNFDTTVFYSTVPICVEGKGLPFK